jgi:hypothetical protein
LPLSPERSIHFHPKYKIEAGGVNECPEVAVSREEQNAPVDTSLGD